MMSQMVELGASESWASHNTAYRIGSIICQTKCKMKLQGPLFKKQKESFFLLSAISLSTHYNVLFIY